jgi:hypothetical protein
MVVAGLYVAYYGWYELRVFAGETEDPIVDRARRVQSWLQDTLVPDEPARVAVVLGVVLVAIGIGIAVRRRRRASVGGDTEVAGEAGPVGAVEDGPAAARAVEGGHGDGQASSSLPMMSVSPSAPSEPT